MKTPGKNAICAAEFKSDLYEDTLQLYVINNTVKPKYPVYTLVINHPTNYWSRDYDTLEEALEHFAGEVADYHEASNWEVVPQ